MTTIQQLTENFEMIRNLSRKHAFDRMASAKLYNELDELLVQMTGIELKLKRTINKLSATYGM